MCTENHLHFDYVRLAWDAGFCFEEYNTKNAFDLSTLGLVDIEKVTRERDIAIVERHIPTILQFHLDEELTRILEPTFVKIFKLCQLALQYLRFCNKYLDNTVIILKKDLSTSNDENMNLSSIIDQLKTENSNLNIKNKELKDAFNHINQSVSFKCHECSKAFATEEYLQAHIARRHDSQTAQIQSESEKLQLEIKELKERLNSTEKYVINNGKGEPNNDDVFGDKEAVLQAKFEQLKEHIEKELSLLRDESFYKGIYEKWFEEVFEKLKGGKKVLVEQGIGDYVSTVESSTQTNVSGNETGEEPVESGGKNDEEIDGKINNACGDMVRENAFGRIEEIEGRTFEKIEQIEGRTIGRIEEIEQRLKVENEAQRELLEKVLEQKLVGTLGKLESQINDFGKKLQHFEMKKREIQKPADLTHREIDIKQLTTAKELGNSKKVINQQFSSTKSDTRFIVAQSAAKVATSSDSETENIPPKPAIRTFEKPPKPPIRVRSMNNREKQESVESIGRKESFAEAKSDSISEEIVISNASERIKNLSPISQDHRFKKIEIDIESNESTSDDSEDFRVIKTVQRNKDDSEDFRVVKPVQKNNDSEDFRVVKTAQKNKDDKIKTVLKENVLKNENGTSIRNKAGFKSETKIKSKGVDLEISRNKSADEITLKRNSKSDKGLRKPKEFPRILVKELEEKQKAKKKAETKNKKDSKQFLGESDSNDDDDGDIHESKTSVGLDEKRLDDLQDELEEYLNLRLKDIGVAPQWKGLPMRNYEHAVTVVEHQASLLSKAIPNFTKIREGLVKIINKNAKREAISEFQLKRESKGKNKPKKVGKYPQEVEDIRNETVADSSDQSSNISDIPVNIKNDSRAVNKKKVLFDLKKEDSVRVIKRVSRDFAGSASSLDSSVFDESPEKRLVEKKDLWSISDAA